jgi:glycosyltransferase involved in cell wall biosynthesis
VRELREQHLVDLEVIDSAQRYRASCDLSLPKRLLGGGCQALRLSKQIVLRTLRIKPQVIYLTSSASFGLLRDLLLTVMGRLLGAVVVVAFHFGRIPQLKAKRNWEWRLLLLTCCMANGVHVLDRRSKDALASALPRKLIEQFCNGIDTAWIDSLLSGASSKRLEAQGMHLVFVGMLLRDKGVVELVRACSLIEARGLTLQMVGPVEPEMKAELCRLAGARDGGGWLAFAGQLSREEVVKRVAAADIFVLPSYTEAFPNSVLEAMACSKPVISTRVGAIPDMLSIGTEEPAGICVPPRAVEPLRDAIARLLTDERRRTAMGAAGRRKCEQEYSLSRLARQWAALWTGEAATDKEWKATRII